MIRDLNKIDDAASSIYLSIYLNKNSFLEFDYCNNRLKLIF